MCALEVEITGDADGSKCWTLEGKEKISGECCIEQDQQSMMNY
jgi:hypothetical protein